MRTKMATSRWECSSNAGAEEAPELPEDDRQRDRERRDEDDLDRREERLGDAERDELANPAPPVEAARASEGCRR
jgi:hypothetical protein